LERPAPVNCGNISRARQRRKAAIAVPSLDKLPTVIDTLITAVRNGELDEQLILSGKQSSAKRRAA